MQINKWIMICHTTNTFFFERKTSQLTFSLGYFTIIFFLWLVRTQLESLENRYHTSINDSTENESLKSGLGRPHWHASMNLG